MLDNHGTIVAFTPFELLGAYKSMCEQLELRYRGSLIWKKTKPSPARRPTYSMACEALFWATRADKFCFVPWGPEHDASNVLEGPGCGGAERLDHPDQKPLWLVRELVARHAIKGMRVFDPFAGVGTTLIACRDAGLACIGCESNANYAVQARMRLKAT